MARKKERPETPPEFEKESLLGANAGEVLAAIRESRSLTDMPAEQATLGACLMERAAISRVSGWLLAEDFSEPAHRVLYEEVQRLYDLVIPVDLVTLQSALPPAQLEACGGLKYLMQLQDSAPTAAAVVPYARAVKTSAQRRATRDAICSLLLKADHERRLRLRDVLDHTTGGEIRLIGMDELLIAEQKVEYLYKPLIPFPGVTVLFGPEGAGKSLLALTLAHAFVHGHAWLGKFHSDKRGGVLFVDAETGQPGTTERIADLDAGAGVRSEYAIYHRQKAEADVFGGDAPQGDEPEQRRVRFWFRKDMDVVLDGRPLLSVPNILIGPVHDIGARFVILDSMASLSGATDLNKREVAGPIIDRLKAFAEQHLLSILLLAHPPKSQLGEAIGARGVAGSGAIAWIADSMLLIVKAGGGTRIVEHKKARHPREFEERFRINETPGPDQLGSVFTHGGVVTEPIVPKMEQACDAIVTVLQVGPMMSEEVRAAVKRTVECGDRTFDDAISSLKREKAITSRTVNRKAQYSLASGGPQ